MRKRTDMIGKRFGRLTVIDYYGVKRHHAQWLCKCDCGLQLWLMLISLMAGKSSHAAASALRKLWSIFLQLKGGKRILLTSTGESPVEQIGST